VPRRWRLRVLLLMSGLLAGTTVIVYAWSRFVYTDARGLACGVRLLDLKDCPDGTVHIVCGIYDDVPIVWYYKTILPLPPTEPFRDWRKLPHQGGGVLGFQVMASFSDARNCHLVFGVPFWFAAALGVTGIIYSLRRLRGNRYGAGHCQTCGYDLRASTERCPECGTPVMASDPVRGEPSS
jgi:hypothetical protein